MPKTVAPEVIAERTMDIVQKISRHIIPTDDPRSSFGFNLWFKNKWVNTYVRQGRRVHADTRAWIYTLEISSIEVKPEKKGYFTSFLNQMERMAKQNGMSVLVENVANEHLAEFMIGRGYTLYRNGQGFDGPPSYWNA